MMKSGVSDANAEHYAKIIKANHAMATALQKLQEVQQTIIDTQNPLEAMTAARDALASLYFEWSDRAAKSVRAGRGVR